MGRGCSEEAAKNYCNELQLKADRILSMDRLNEGDYVLKVSVLKLKKKKDSKKSGGK